MLAVDKTDLLIAGFAVFGDYEDAHIKDAQATAHVQMLKWLKEH